ncbi:hypothetical protein Pfo_020216 [Paulownia fortunei]|nr:hypothetical protein Pfo_020216 [Paulownia fortunei]
MEAEFPKLKAAPSFKPRFDTTTTISAGDLETDHLPRYTSLKDIILSSSPKHAACNNEPGNISIRNELVKHAASAYVLSATIINPGNRDQDWINPCGLWDKIKISCVGLQSCWQIHVRLPLQAFCRPVVELFYQVVRRVGHGLRGKVEIT